MKLLRRLWRWMTCQRRLPESDRIGELLGLPHAKDCHYIHDGECL